MRTYPVNFLLLFLLRIPQTPSLRHRPLELRSRRAQVIGGGGSNDGLIIYEKEGGGEETYVRCLIASAGCGGWARTYAEAMSDVSAPKEIHQQHLIDWTRERGNERNHHTGVGCRWRGTATATGTYWYMRLLTVGASQISPML